MSSQVFYENVIVFTTHWDDDLFSGKVFDGYLDARFQLRVVFDDIANLINFLYIEGRECFFDFKHLRSVHSLF